MRVTDSGMAEQYLSSIAKTQGRLTNLQSQIASGKRVQKVSDDPQAANSILRLNSYLSSNVQYSKNNAEALTMTDATMSSMQNFSDVLGQVKELVVRANNGALTDERPTFAQTIDKLLDDAVNAANTQYNGKYLFAGTNTLQTPFTMAADRSAVTTNPNGITGTIEYPVGEGMTQKVNMDGQEAFEGTSIFTTLINLRNSLNAGQLPNAADATALDNAIQYVNSQTSTVGMIVSQLNNNTDTLSAQNTQLTDLISTQGDTDIASAITQMKQEETNLEAALNVTAQIIPKSLLDYLR